MVTCRACLETNKEMRPLDEPFAIHYNLLTELEIFVGDKMSQDICCDCWDTVNYFINFRTRCITSESVMKNEILNIVKDDPDGTINTETCLNIDLNPVVKDEPMDSDVFVNIYDNDSVDTKITLDIPLLSTTNVLLEDVAKESKRFLRKREKKEQVINVNIVKRKRYIKNKNNVKMKKPPKSKDIKKIKSNDAKITQKLKIKESAATKLKQHCGICIASFDNKKELYDHLEGHKKDTLCKLCDEQFDEWPEMLGHRLKHTPENKTSCHLCDKYCVRPAYMEHHYRNMHYVGSVKLKCNQCERSFRTPQHLRKHKWSVHSKKQFICDNCGESFNTKSKMKTHVLKHTTHKSLVCKLCDYSTKYISCLRSHIIGKHTKSKVYCDDCGVLFPCQEKLDQHVCKQNSKVCPICGMKMLKSVRLSRHLKTHREEKPFKCDTCDASYKSKVALQIHRDKHAGNRTKHCEYCPAKFYNGSSLIRHRRIHTGERPYVCKTCGKGFTTKFNLKLHMQIHGEFLINKKLKPED